MLYKWIFIPYHKLFKVFLCNTSNCIQKRKPYIIKMWKHDPECFTCMYMWWFLSIASSWIIYLKYCKKIQKTFSYPNVVFRLTIKIFQKKMENVAFGSYFVLMVNQFQIWINTRRWISIFVEIAHNVKWCKTIGKANNLPFSILCILILVELASLFCKKSKKDWKQIASCAIATISQAWVSSTNKNAFDCGLNGCNRMLFCVISTQYFLSPSFELYDISAFC